MLLAMQMLSAQMMAPQGHCALLELAHTLVNASLSSAVVEVELRERDTACPLPVLAETRLRYMQVQVVQLSDCLHNRQYVSFLPARPPACASRQRN